jgi:hypothetical protein
MNIRLSLAFGFALFVAALAHAADAPSVKQRPVDTPHRILFVGNSYLYYNDSLHNHVRRMVAAAGIATEKQLHYKSATIGGAPLSEQDVKSLLVPGRLGKEPFEIVILQGNSSAALSGAKRKSFHDKVVEFNADIVRAGAKTALYMTHAYVAPNKNASPDMIRKVEDLYVSVGNEVGAYVIPVGRAFEESYRRRPDFLLHKTYDGSHPNLYGTYLAACVVFASLYGKSPVGNSYDYFGAVHKGSAAYLQQVAEDTVKKFYGR